jgi:hypothetical protein
MGSVALGGSDCEALRHGLLGQPANAVSSASYAVVGAWLLAGTLRAPAGQRLMQTAYAGSLIAVGVGSVAYHGPMPPGAQLAHDLPIITLLTVVTLRNISALGVLGHCGASIWAGVGSAGCGLLLARQPGGYKLLGGIAVGLALASEALVQQRDRRRAGQVPGAGRPLPYWAAIALLAAGLVLDYLGRTGGPLCRPGSVLQPHAGWHALSALAAGLYGRWRSGRQDCGAWGTTGGTTAPR